MINRHMRYLLLACLFVWLSCPAAAGADLPLPEPGKKWRIGYYEGGPYTEYTDTMRTFVKALVEKGWIKEAAPPDIFDEVEQPYIDWLSRAKTPYLSILPENCYSAGWDDKKRIQNRSRMLNKLKAGKLDLVIAMGTWAGLDLATDEHQVPVMVMSTSDPIRSGIIKSARDSGRNHVTARVDPDRYKRQIRMFHRIVGFKTLGVAYENVSDGKIYSAVDQVEQVAAERGFKAVYCVTADTTDPDSRANDLSCLECFTQLVQKADAIYITALLCIENDINAIAQLFRNQGIPSFSMVGSKYVQKGLMMSISNDSGYATLGRYNADKFTRILGGTRPRDLKMILEDPLDIAVNMETVRQINFDMPKSIIGVTTELYEKQTP